MGKATKSLTLDLPTKKKKLLKRSHNKKGHIKSCFKPHLLLKIIEPDLKNMLCVRSYDVSDDQYSKSFTE